MITPRRWLVTTLAATGLVLLAPPAAQAHEPAATLVSVSRTAEALVLDVRVPLDRYDFAYGTDLAEDADARAAAYADLREQLQDTVAVSSVGGVRWQITSTTPTTEPLQGTATLAVRLTARPPSGPATGPVDLRWDLVTEAVASHRVYVVTSDDAGAVLDDESVTDAEVLGLVTAREPVLRIGEPASHAHTWTTLLGVGFAHFREGPDHLLFLCLVALGAARRRGGWRRTTLHLAGLTVAFTLGHSLSLATATLGLLAVPTRWIEAGIAVTIVLAAGHALRPRLGHRSELFVTGGFGLVHGFGFAGTLTDLAISGRDAVVPLLAFNLGLEAAQLLALLLVAVPVVVLARSRTATVAVATAAGLVAMAWIGERLLGWPDPLAPLVETLAATPERLAVVLAVVALATTARARTGSGAPRPRRVAR